MFVVAMVEGSAVGYHSDESGARYAPYRPIELEATEGAFSGPS